MADVVFIGGGIVGTCAAMMLARDGHAVTVLERDPAAPPSPGVAWDDWERRGVNQFRQIHLFPSRFRDEADRELPGLTAAMEAAGGLRVGVMKATPNEVTGGLRDGDERYDYVTARRPVAEAVVACQAAAQDGLTVRRGVGVTGLLTHGGSDGAAHVEGVVTDAGEVLRADLVVDCSGRRSPVRSMLADAGFRGPEETVDDGGFVYFGRHFRSADGSVPPNIGPLLQDYGTITTLTLPADNGTWGVGIVASSKDAALRRLADVGAWTDVIRSIPLVAHWIDAEPLTDIAVMAKIEDRMRAYVVDGTPRVTGLVPLADAHACTNPSLGRGVSIGMVHAAALRRHLRSADLDDVVGFACGWAEATASSSSPLFADTLRYDRHRLAEVDALIAGADYAPGDDFWTTHRTLEAKALTDPDLFRAYLDIVAVMAPASEVLARPALRDRLVGAAPAPGAMPFPGPTRLQLLELVGAAA